MREQTAHNPVKDVGLIGGGWPFSLFGFLKRHQKMLWGSATAPADLELLKGSPLG